MSNAKSIDEERPHSQSSITYPITQKKEKVRNTEYKTGLYSLTKELQQEDRLGMTIRKKVLRSLFYIFICILNSNVAGARSA